MTLAALLKEVHTATGWAHADIHSIVRNAWPDHQNFTETQAALVVRAVLKREARNA